MKENKFDIIVIGSGAGGLGAGLTIQTKNPSLRTLIIEKNNYPGGFIGGFSQKGFYFDAAAEAILSMEKGNAESPILTNDFNHPFIKMDVIEAYYDRNRVFHLYSNEIKLLQEIKKHFPDQAEKARDFITTCIEMRDELIKGKFMNKKLTLKMILKMILKYPNLRTYGRKNFRQFLDSFFTNEQLKDYFLIYPLWLGLTFDELKAPAGAYLLAYSITNGLFYPKGGMDALAKKLAKVFIAHGGTLKYKTVVEKIIIEDKKAIGIKLRDGTKYQANYVISNADLKRTIMNYVGKEYFDKNYIHFIKNLKQSMTGLMLFLGVENMDLTQYPAHFHIGVNPNIIEKARRGQFELKEGLAIRIIGNKDPENRVDNKDSLHALYIAPYDWSNYWRTGKIKNRQNEKYKILKENLVEKMVKLIEQIIPEISKHITYRSLATPLTFERYNFVTNGSWYGPRYDQELPPLTTPIGNLFLAGSNTAGSGVSNSLYSGIETAYHVLELINKEK